MEITTKPVLATTPPPAKPAASGAGPPRAAPAASFADHADIRPLDIPAALQILLAEVRTELDLPKSAGGLGVIENPLQAAQALVEMILHSMPGESRLEALVPSPPAAPDASVVPVLDAAPPVAAPTPISAAIPVTAPVPVTAEAAAWSAAVSRAQTALQSGLQRAVDSVAAWRDVSPAVLDAARDTRALVYAVLSDELPNPLWLRPEWLGLAPRLERFRRRRRGVHRRWIDPDGAPVRREGDDDDRP